METPSLLYVTILTWYHRYFVLYIIYAAESWKPLLGPRQSPSPHGQALKLKNPRPDVHGESEDTEDDANNVDSVVPVVDHLASAAASNTPLLVCLHSAREWLRDKGTLELCLQLGVARVASSAREGVDEAEDEVSGEGAAQVGNTIFTLY